MWRNSEEHPDVALERHERLADEDAARDADLARHMRHTPAPRSAPLVGVARILDMADRWRRLGGAAVKPHALYQECVEAFSRGEIRFGEVTPLYGHAMIHAGAIVPCSRERFLVCPRCEAKLDWPV